MNDHKAVLAFLLHEVDPDWDGSYTTVKSPAGKNLEPLGLVEFECCIAAKLGSPNDEVIGGHPLDGKGLVPYAAQRVVNSRWLKEVERVDSVHDMYRPESWRDVQHFIFWFHDTTFECLAKSLKVEVHRIPIRDLLNQMVDRLMF